MTAISVRLFGGPSVQRGDEVVRLTPYQRAFLTIVFERSVVSRSELARLLWNAEADSKVRSRIRQLRHQTNRRVGVEIVAARDDDLYAPDAIPADIADVKGALSEGRGPEMSGVILRGFAPQNPQGVSLEFLDWRDGRDKDYRQGLRRSAEALWETSTETADWSSAVRAADALAKIEGPNPKAYARLIEAHARAGYVRDAEAAYSEYRRTCARDDSAEDMDALMLRIRRMSRESNATSGVEEIPFFGRRDSVRELRRVVDAVADGSCSVAVVQGEAGIGKTRLLHEVRRAATLDGFRCVTGSPTSLERRISLSPIFDALSTLDLIPHLEAIGEPWRSVATSIMPARWDVGERREPPPIDETALSRRLLESFALLIHSIAEEQPTLLFIDDAHWADTTTLSLLDFYQRRWRDSKLGIFMAVRPELVEPEGVLEELLVGGMELSTRLDIGEVDAEAGRQIVDAVAGSEIPAAQAAKLISIAGLHPLYLIELTREASENRLTLDRAVFDPGSVPASVRQIVAARLRGAGELASRAIRVFAASDRIMSAELLGQVLDCPIEQAAEVVDELQENRLLCAEGRGVRIAHSLFGKAVYDQITPTVRGVIHAKIASRLEARGEASEGELAIQFDRAGESEKAARHGWVAANRYLERGATAEASHFYRLVARNEPNPTLRAQALAGEAESAFLARDLVVASEATRTASDALRAIGQLRQARVLDVRRISALTYLGRGDAEAWLADLQRLADAAESEADYESAALAFDAELQVRYRHDRLTGVDELLSRMERLSQRADGNAAVLSNLGLALSIVFGDPEQALRSARLAVSHSERAPKYRALALTRLMVVLMFRGQLLTPEGGKVAEAAMRQSQSIGDARLTWAAQSNRAIGLLDAGELAQAEIWFEEAAATVGQLEPGPDTFNWFFNRGELEVARGNWSEAKRYYEKSEAQVGRRGPAFVAAIIDARIGLCALETGDLSEARLRERNVPTEIPLWCYDPLPIVAFRTRLLKRRGRLREALPMLEQVSEKTAGRFDLAWLRLGILRLETMLTLGAPLDLDTVEEYLGFAKANNLKRWGVHIEELGRRGATDSA